MWHTTSRRKEEEEEEEECDDPEPVRWDVTNLEEKGLKSLGARRIWRTLYGNTSNFHV